MFLPKTLHYKKCPRLKNKLILRLFCGSTKHVLSKQFVLFQNMFSVIFLNKSWVTNYRIVGLLYV